MRVSSDGEGFGDPAPAAPAPPWAAQMVAEARLLAGGAVYPPSDDTFLLLEALAADGERLRSLRPGLCLDVGSGSGVLLCGLVAVLGGAGALADPAPAPPCGWQGGTRDAEARTGTRTGAGAFGVEVGCLPPPEARGGGGERGAAAATAARALPRLLAIDKNPDACACTAKLLRRCGVSTADVVQASPDLGLRLCSSVDICVFNPPYVPGDAEEMLGHGISVSWAGGHRGREVMDSLLPHIAGALAPGGLLFLVCLVENDPEEIMAEMQSRHGLSSKMVRREQRGIEELCVLRFEHACCGGLS